MFMESQAQRNQGVTYLETMREGDIEVAAALAKATLSSIERGFLAINHDLHRVRFCAGLVEALVGSDC